MAESNKELPRVSFLTLNYKQADITLDLLESLKHINYPNWEIVVVDNGPENVMLKEAAENMMGGQYLATNANLGFAGGNNAGIPLCTGKYIAFVNNDTEIPRDFLDKIVPFMESAGNLGMLSPKICYFDNKELIQYAGFTPLSKISMRNEGIGYMQKDRGQFNDIRLTAFIHGAAMLVPQRVIEEVGMMYDDYFLYYEEIDWCERIKKAGYSIWYYGESFLYHKESVSTGVDSPLKIYYLTRNRLLFARRNFSAARAFLTFLYFSFIAMPKNVLQWLLKGRPDLARAFFKGYFWNLTHKSKPLEDRN